MVINPNLMRAERSLFGLSLTESEFMPRNILLANLTKLDLFVGRFGAAVALFDLCDPQGPNPAIPADHVDHIRIMSGNDGAMTIFNFGKQVQAIRRNVHELPSLASHIRTGELKLAEQLFKSAFPSFELVRHAAAHPAELFSTSRSATQNAAVGDFDTPIGRITNDGGMVAWLGNFVNRTYSSMIEKQVVSYELAWPNQSKLAGIADKVYSAFGPPISSKA